MNEAEKSGECAIGYIRRRGRRDVAFGNSYISSHEVRVFSPYLDVQYKYILYIQRFYINRPDISLSDSLNMQQLNRR